MEQLTLHEYAPSGNCYKIRLTAALLGVPLRRRHYDILKGETRTPEFLDTVSANGRAPVLQIGNRFLPESNAAIYYLADGSALIPEDRFDRADVLRWMAWEQYNHEPNIATLRFWLAFVGEGNLTESQRAMIPAKREAGVAALDLMEDHLRTRAYFVAGRLTLADIALHAYTSVMDEGGFDARDWPAIAAWLDRVAATPGYVPLSA
jgi:glutathione S-transferase